jgi:hypothetical protein
MSHKISTTNDLFDTLVGWSAVYPPSDKALGNAYDEANQIIRDAYDDDGIDLTAIAPGEPLWFGGPKAERFTLALSDDWSVDFKRAIKRAGGDPEDEATWQAAQEFANEIERAANDDLKVWLDEHGDELPEWKANRFSGYTIK